MTISWQRLIPVGFAVVFLSGLIAAETGRPPLLEASKSGDKDAIKAQLQKKADANAADADGTTALHWASYHDDLESADLLIRAGAKVNAITDLGVTPLWLASENGSSAMVRRLLAAGADPNMALTAGETPVMVAARSGASDAVEQLLAKGANPNAHGARGQTALMWAVSQQHPEVVEGADLAHRADLNLPSPGCVDRRDGRCRRMAISPTTRTSCTVARPRSCARRPAWAIWFFSEAPLLAAGANVNDANADAWGVSAITLAEHSGFSATSSCSCSTKARIRMPLPTALTRCTKPSCAAMRRLWPRCSITARTPTLR